MSAGSELFCALVFLPLPERETFLANALVPHLLLFKPKGRWQLETPRFLRNEDSSQLTLPTGVTPPDGQEVAQARWFSHLSS